MSFAKQIPSLLKKGVPAAVILRSATKLSPVVSNFITTGLASGYAANDMLSYLQDKLGGSEGRVEGDMRSKGRLRPDEMAALEEMKGRDLPGKVAAAGVGLAAGAIPAAISGVAGLAGGLLNRKGEETPTEKPTAAGVVEQFAGGRFTPERAFKAFVDAGEGDKITKIISRSETMDNAMRLGMGTISDDVLQVASQMFDVPAEEVLQAALSHAATLRGKKRKGATDLLGVPPPEATAPQAGDANAELIAAIQNLRSMFQQ